MSYKISEVLTVSSGGTSTIDLAEFRDSYYITGTVSLASSYSVTTTGTAQAGMKLVLHYSATVTLGTSTHITVLGTQIPDGLVTKKLIIEAVYNGSAWKVVILASLDQTNIISVGNIENTSITLDKLVNITAGSLVVGNSSGVPTATVLKGAATLASDGTLTLGSEQVEDSNIKEVAITKVAITGAADKILSSSSSTDTAVESDVTVAEATVLHSVTPGTSAASKAVVLDSSSKINVIDITSLLLGGVAISVDATQINKLAVTTNGTVESNKVLITGSSKTLDELNIVTLHLNGTAITSNAGELNVLDGIDLVVADLNLLKGLAAYGVTNDMIKGLKP